MKKSTRQRVFEVIETASTGDKASHIYDVAMMITIVISILPLAFKGDHIGFTIVDKITVSIFIIDYLLRLGTADVNLKKGKLSFILYPITPMALIDLFSILPSFTSVDGAFRLLKIFRLLRTFKVFRVFKFIRYSKSIQAIIGVFRSQKRTLLTVLGLAIAYVLIAALVIFNVEPDTFDNFFEAIYWATVSLTTVGYGDIYPVSTLGRIITMISSFFGIAIIALPAGIITAGYMDEINKLNKKDPPDESEKNKE